MKTSSQIKVLCLGAALALAGCSSDSTEETIVLPSSQANETSVSVPDELLYNYAVLDIYYFYSHIDKELSDSVTDYYNAPIQLNYGYSYCTEGYTDVCYMYSMMSDPFTRYYAPYYATQVKSMLTSSEQTVGIGAEIGYAGEDSTAIIFTQVYGKSPAQTAGLKENDTLLTIDNTVPVTTSAAEKLLSGQSGDTVAVSVKRNEDTLALKIAIGPYATPTVYLSYQDSIPVIRITSFATETVSDSGTYGEFVTALKKTEGSNSTIIDLRGNPGGIVGQCNSVSAELLDNGDTIVIDIVTNADSSLVGNSKSYFQVFDTTAYTATKDGMAKDRYYVFLADSTSASCAEVMLSAISVNKKSPIVGLTSYGKGIGQLMANTPMDGLAVITAMRSTDKNGDIYHRVGIVPDYVTGDSTEQMAKAVEWAKERSKTRRTTGYYGTESTGHFTKSGAPLFTESVKTGFPTGNLELLKQLGGKIVIQ